MLKAEQWGLGASRTNVRLPSSGCCPSCEGGVGGVRGHIEGALAWPPALDHPQLRADKEQEWWLLSVSWALGQHSTFPVKKVSDPQRPLSGQQGGREGGRHAGVKIFGWVGMFLMSLRLHLLSVSYNILPLSLLSKLLSREIHFAAAGHFVWAGRGTTDAGGK